MKRAILNLSLATLVAAAAHAAPLAPIALWPGQGPSERGVIGPEHDRTTDSDRTSAGRRVTRITDVATPTLTVYLPAREKRTGAAVLVFPGGAYRHVAIDLEGTEVCEWLNSIGVAGILVKYRVPARDGLPPHALPLQDAQRALGMVRARAAEWQIDPKRIGVLGFSAGAHLSATLSTNFGARAYARIDHADDQSCRPDFVMLLYPAYLVKPGSNKPSPELHVSRDTPPTFIVQTQDDVKWGESSLTYYAALKAANVPVEMHLYTKGGHGYGLRPSGNTVETWPARAADWMRALGVLAPEKGRPDSK